MRATALDENTPLPVYSACLFRQVNAGQREVNNGLIGSTCVELIIVAGRKTLSLYISIIGEEMYFEIAALLCLK